MIDAAVMVVLCGWLVPADYVWPPHAGLNFVSW
jgi:hypothetical protein